MTPLDALIREAWRAGVALVAAPPDRVTARFDGDRPDDLLSRLRAHKPALVALACPACGHVRCGDLICWREGCGYRPCGHCGHFTGSPFLRYCVSCGSSESGRGT